MKVIVYNDRDLNVIEEYSTQNENDFEVMEFKFSSIFDNYNKKIVFLTPDGNISYYIKNNKFSIPREITQYEQVKFYIWCTFENKDFRTKLKILSFYKNENVNIDILPLEKAQIEEIINELEKNILIVQNLEKQTNNLIDEIETKLKNGDFKGDKGDKGEPGESYDDTEIKEEISDIKEEQTTQNTRIEELEEQVSELENNQLTGTATGQSIYIEDSTNTKVRSIGLSGNSEQDGTPTPENPIEIYSTGVSGSVNEKVQNKNLFDGEIELGGINPSNGSLTESTSRTRSKNFIKVNPNTTYTIQRQGGAFRWIIGYTKNKTGISDGTVQGYASSLESLGLGILSKSFTTSATTEYIKWYDTDFTDLTEKVQIEQGTTATDYDPHEEQDISFPLAEGQKLMQGDYLADDGIHHVRGEVVLDGSDDEGWTLQSSSSSSTRTVFKSQINGLNNYTNNQDIPNLCSSHFIPVSQATTWKNGDISRSENTNSIFLIMQANISIEDFKAWLAQQYANGTPVKVQYELAEEVIESFTEEQQAVWEQIKALRTYKPVTHISSTDEVPATVNLTYVKDLETVINNLGG